MSTEKRILVVDDSTFDRSLLMKALATKGGYVTIEADSGAKCLELIQSEKIDLILLDIMMPGIPGPEVLKTIREKFNPVQLPVIMITAKADAADVVHALHLGANDYITKPVHFEVAISRIVAHLQLADFSSSMAKLQEIAALHAMVSTYNHEINNPLTIALGWLRKITETPENSAAIKKTEEALWRVVDIVKKIHAITEKNGVQYEPYAGLGKMVKVK